MWSFLGREGVRERAKGWYFWPYGVGAFRRMMSSSRRSSRVCLVSVYLPLYAFSSLLFSLVDG